VEILQKSGTGVVTRDDQHHESIQANRTSSWRSWPAYGVRKEISAQGSLSGHRSGPLPDGAHAKEN